MRAKALYTFYPDGKTSTGHLGTGFFAKYITRRGRSRSPEHAKPRREKKKALFIPIYIYECFMQYSFAYVTRLYDNVRGREAGLIALWINYVPLLTAHRRTFRSSIEHCIKALPEKKKRKRAKNKAAKLSTSDCSAILYGDFLLTRARNSKKFSAIPTLWPT